MTEKLTCYESCRIPPSRVNWLWKPYLARGKLALLDGDPGTGKSFLTVDLAARLSRGGPLPDGQTLDRPHHTVLISGEDHASDTIRPRLEAAGADLGRIQVVAPGLDTRLPRLPDDFLTIKGIIDYARADLLVIDPVMAFLGDSVCATSDQSIRRVFTELASIAADYDCAILLIRHMVKTLGSWKAIYRGSGSIGMIGACRTGLMLGPHPDDPSLRVLSMTKSNVGSPGLSRCFRLAECGEDQQTRVEWLGRADVSANDLCAATPAAAGNRPRDRAKEWLREQLAGGKKRAAELEAAAKEAGIAQRTLYRAKDDLRVVSEREKTDDGSPGEAWWHDPAVPKPRVAFDDLPPLPPLEDFLEMELGLLRTKRKPKDVASDGEDG